MSAKKQVNTPKKASDVSWYKCEKCEVYLSKTNLNNHESECGKLTKDNIFHTFCKGNEINCKTITPMVVPSDLARFNKSFIFIPECVLRIASLQIGQNVQLKFINQDIAPLVRTAWVSGDNHEIFLGFEDLGSSPVPQTNLENIQIKPISMDLFQIESVLLKPLESDLMSDRYLKDMETSSRRILSDKIVCENTIISLKLLGKNLNFQIAEIEPVINELPLEHHLENLTLNDVKFYVFKSETKIKIDIKSSPSKVQPIKNLFEIGGLDKVLKETEQMILTAINTKENDSRIKSGRKGILLHGPSGCGKTLLCDALKLNQNFKDFVITKIQSSDVFGKYLGESDSKLSNYFKSSMKNSKPTLLIIDDIQIFCRKNDNSDLNRRITNTLVNCLDEINSNGQGQVFVIATAPKLDDINPGIFRSGRIDHIIEVPIPSPEGRLEILKRNIDKIFHNLTESDVKVIADITHGFSGADLISLISKATSMEISILTLSNMNHALTLVKPSAMREIQIEVPKVKWTDVGGQHELKLKLQQSVDWPIRKPEIFKRFGIKPPKGILMYGPPGCSKTMIARALATESSFNFLSIKGSDLFSMWVGESERAVRELFRKARAVSPSIIFFDEMDAIGGERATDGGGTSVNDRVLAQLLMEMDGVTTLDNVTIIAATNRPDLIDKALLRPGRIDRIVYVRLPDEQTRQEIFKIKLEGKPIAEEIDVNELVKRTDGYSGAEINAVCEEAALNALEEDLNAEFIQQKHFEYALSCVKPRTSQDLLKLYNSYENQFKSMK